MAIATTCITNSISLQPGTSFILPPGSTIVGASNVSNISSTCADLSHIEQIDCYAFLFAGFSNDQAGATQYSDDSSQFIMGYTFNGVYTAFQSRIINNNTNGSFNMVELRDNLVTKIPAIISTNIGYKTDSNVAHRNSMSILVVKTFPSIAASLQVVVDNEAPLDSTGGIVQYNVPLIKLSNLIAQGYLGLPTCPQ